MSDYKLATTPGPMTKERLKAIQYEVELEFNGTPMAKAVDEVFELAWRYIDMRDS